MRGTLSTITSARASTQAASTGRASFLLPAGVTVPRRGWPPSTRNRSPVTGVSSTRNHHTRPDFLFPRARADGPPRAGRARAAGVSSARMSERFFILDGPGFLFRAYHALPFLSTSRGVPSHAVFGTSTMLWKVLREDSPDYFAVAWDPPGPTFREEKFA